MVRRGMTGATGNVYVGLHEFADMGFVLHFLRPGDLFVDVGANVGSYTVLASRVCGADVVAFEPDPGTLAHLSENVRANGVGQLVAAKESAVGATVGEIGFSTDQDTVNHVVEGGSDGHSRTVAIVTLDVALADRHPALIKVDVEGHESAVIAGALATLADPALKGIILEGYDDVALASLSHHGFRQYAYDPFSRRLTPEALHRGGNTLFLRDEAFIAERLASAPRRKVLGQAV